MSNTFFPLSFFFLLPLLLPPSHSSFFPTESWQQTNTWRIQGRIQTGSQDCPSTFTLRSLNTPPLPITFPPISSHYIPLPHFQITPITLPKKSFPFNPVPHPLPYHFNLIKIIYIITKVGIISREVGLIKEL